MDWGFNPVAKPSHKRNKKKKADRGEFPEKIRKQIVKDQNGQCQLCGRPTTYIHHVKPRGRGGRGVYTNGLLACVNCHNPKIHDRPGGVDHWIAIFEQRFGPDFYKDEEDLKQKYI
jgi:5-methylcytosine-specific restriction endonuclease McrA